MTLLFLIIGLFRYYRPYQKIFEYVLLEQLVDHLLTNNLLCAEQFGFRTRCSTVLAALKLVDHKISQIVNGYNPLNIYIDLSKALDTLDHNILLENHIIMELIN